MNVLLECQQLTLQQGGKTLVDKLDLNIHSNECWAILGPNGAGKSTLLHAMGGLLPTYTANIQLQQQALSNYSARQRAQHIGLLLQQSETGFGQSVFEMVVGGLYPHQSTWQWRNQGDSVLDALKQVGLADKAQQPLLQLSGGELRRAEIARLLLQNPNLALLDEPLNHLDIGQQMTLLHTLRTQFKNTQQSLVLVLHDINLACHVADHLILLFGDGSWLAGKTERLATQEHLSQLFQYSLKKVNTQQGKLFSVNYSQLF